MGCAACSDDGSQLTRLVLRSIAMDPTLVLPRIAYGGYSLLLLRQNTELK